MGRAKRERAPHAGAAPALSSVEVAGPLYVPPPARPFPATGEPSRRAPRVRAGLRALDSGQLTSVASRRARLSGHANGSARRHNDESFLWGPARN